MDSQHRRSAEEVAAVQRGNQAWWTTNTMSYDWNDKVRNPRYSAEWFDEIDKRFIEAARLFATDRDPFDRIIPLSQLSGKRVLEIGCGMGLHSEVMVRAGAHLTAVDLSPTSVEATSRRLALKGLAATVLQADAEGLPFEAKTFDFVWSWGVIHHSSRTGRIVREIARLLRPEGETRVMVYNRHAASVMLSVLRDQLVHGGLRRRTLEESYYASSDGYSARFYTQDQFEDLFRAFFSNVTSSLCGQEVDAVPLPAGLRRWVTRLLPEEYLRRAQERRGAFILLRADHPI